MAKIPLHNLIESILKIEKITDPKKIEELLSNKKKLQELVDKINKLQEVSKTEE